MAYAKCTFMGSTIKSILIPNCYVACKVRNKLVILESKRQKTNTLFTLHLNFNKLEASLLLVLTLAMKPPWKISYLKKCSHLPKALGVILHQMFVIIIVKTLNLCEFHFTFFATVPCPIVFPCRHEAMTCLSPIFACSNLCSHYLGRHFVSRWLHFWYHLYGVEGFCPPCIPSFSSNLSRSPKC
jgi:hypothetical protein